MSGPAVRRVRNDLFFVEWGNVRFGGTFSELATFAAELQAEMTKALAGDPESKRHNPGHSEDAWKESNPALIRR